MRRCGDWRTEPLGTVVPADFMFEQMQAAMVQQGVLLRELEETIRKQDRLSARLCGLIFLIRKLPRTAGADCGVRATPEMLADLLVSDLSERRHEAAQGRAGGAAKARWTKASC